MSGVKLGWKSEDQIYKETVTIPVVAGLIVVVVTVVGLYLFREGRTYTSSLGSRRVTSGGKSVRRSVRNQGPKKNITRWSPDDMGSPTGMSKAGKADTSAKGDSGVVSPVLSKAAAKVQEVVSEVLETPPKKRGRPRKNSTPGSLTSPATSPSPTRRRGRPASVKKSRGQQA